MVARATLLLAWLLLALPGVSPAMGQELRRNSDGSQFAVHIDPRARPRMSTEELIALTERTAREHTGNAAKIVRIEILSGEDLLRFHPLLGPAPDAGRWYWVVWREGDFREGGPPGGPELRGRLGSAVYDDALATFLAGGFRSDANPDPPASQFERATHTAPTSTPCSR